ncbi:MAG: hypothetical protein QM682_18350 [Paracoccus sp. (in: a-proteobacteria)]
MPYRPRKGQWRQAIRLPQGDSASRGSRPPTGEDRRPAALDLQTGKLNARGVKPPLTVIRGTDRAPSARKFAALEAR